MIYATFSESMISMLMNFIGCSFNSYECIPIGNGTYGNLRIQINGEAFEIQNQQRVVIMNTEPVELSSFSIAKATGKFEPVCDGQLSLTIIEDTVQDVLIIQDFITLPSGDQILMDMAVVFKAKHASTMFSRDAWFSEFITISETADLDTIYPICRAKDSWRNDGKEEVIVRRTIISLKNSK